MHSRMCSVTQVCDEEGDVRDDNSDADDFISTRRIHLKEFYEQRAEGRRSGTDEALKER